MIRVGVAHGLIPARKECVVAEPAAKQVGLLLLISVVNCELYLRNLAVPGQGNLLPLVKHKGPSRIRLMGGNRLNVRQSTRMNKVTVLLLRIKGHINMKAPAVQTLPTPGLMHSGINHRRLNLSVSHNLIHLQDIRNLRPVRNLPARHFAIQGS